MSQNVFLFHWKGIYTGTCIIYENEAGLQWIISLIQNIVTVSLSCNVTPSNESMYPSFVKFCRLKMINLVSMEDAVQQFPHHEWWDCSPCPAACVWSGIVMQIEDIIDWQDLTPSDYHLFGPMKEANIMPVMRKWKLQWWSGWTNTQQNFWRQRYMLSFEGRTSLLRETMTMLRSGNVIHRRKSSFWCMIQVLFC